MRSGNIPADCRNCSHGAKEEGSGIGERGHSDGHASQVECAAESISEGQTGNLTFGAGFGSVERAVVFFELTQGNFDLFNWRSGFRGDGQKFRVRASIGSVSSQILLSFEEPWLFEQR